MFVSMLLCKYICLEKLVVRCIYIDDARITHTQLVTALWGYLHFMKNIVDLNEIERMVDLCLITHTKFNIKLSFSLLFDLIISNQL
jgi:hypothetical protein